MKRKKGWGRRGGRWGDRCLRGGEGREGGVKELEWREEKSERKGKKGWEEEGKGEAAMKEGVWGGWMEMEVKGKGGRGGEVEGGGREGEGKGVGGEVGGNGGWGEGGGGDKSVRGGGIKRGEWNEKGE